MISNQSEQTPVLNMAVYFASGMEHLAQHIGLISLCRRVMKSYSNNTSVSASDLCRKLKVQCDVVGYACFYPIRQVLRHVLLGPSFLCKKLGMLEELISSLHTFWCAALFIDAEYSAG